MVLGVVLPLHEERQLRVGLQALDADLLPAQLVAVGPVAVALHGLTAETLLERGDVGDGDHPAEPAAAELRARAHGLAERGLVGGGVVEALDHLDVGACAERQHHVAGAEAGVDAAVEERFSEQVPQPSCGAGEPVRSGGVREMVQAHSVIVDRRRGPGTAGSGRWPAAGGPGRTTCARGPVQRVRRSRLAGWMASALRGAGGRAVLRQLVVRRRAHQLGELGGVGDVDRLGGDVGLGVARAVPVEVVPAGAPAGTLVLRDGDLEVAGVVGQLDGAVGAPDRQLPADVRLGRDEVLAGAQRQAVQGAAGAGREPGRLRKTQAPSTTRVLRSPSSSVSTQRLRPFARSCQSSSVSCST